MSQEPEPPAATPTPAPAPEPAPAPKDTRVTQANPVLGIVAGVLSILLAVLVVVAGMNALDPRLLSIRGTMPYLVVVVAIGALALAYFGARLRRSGTKAAVDASVNSDVALWVALAVVMIGGISYGQKLQKREANRESLLRVDGRARAALGMHFIIAYPGPIEAENLIRMRAVSGFFFDSRHTEEENIETFRTLTKRLQSIAIEARIPPLLLCTDQEGGLVQKLSPPLPPTFSIHDIADSAGQDLEQVRENARELGVTHGQALRSVGINLNLAPVADLMPPAAVANDSQTHLEQRAFSADPALTQAAVAGYVEGLQSQGVRSVLKHFPGIAGVTVDTHKEAGELTKPVAELRTQDWVPFLETLKTVQPQPAVMLSHTRVSELTGDELASYSAKAVEVLRAEAPEVVTFTDCFSMQPIWAGPGGVEEATHKALEAGVDFILFAWDGDVFYDAFAHTTTLLDTRKLTVPTMQASAKRILAYREKIWLPTELDAKDVGAVGQPVQPADATEAGTPADPAVPAAAEATSEPARAAADPALPPAATHADPVERAPVTPAGEPTPPAEVPPAEAFDAAIPEPGIAPSVNPAPPAPGDPAPMP